METLNIRDYICSYDTSQEAARKVVDTIIQWCNKYNCTGGEMLCQDDDCMIESPYLVADIIDNVLKFEHKLSDDWGN